MSRTTSHGRIARRIIRVATTATAAFTLVACAGDTTAPQLIDLQSVAAIAAKGQSLTSLGWQAEARSLVGANNFSPLAAGRVFAALSVAQYQAVAAVDDGDRYGKLPASGTGAGGRSLLEERRGAVAGASAEVLSYLFPAAASSLEERVLADGEEGPGSVHPMFTRGLAFGRAIGKAMVARAKNDRFSTPWTGSVPVGPDKWVANGTPAGATLGGMLPYFMTSGAQFRPAPPPAFGSALFLADVAEIRTLSDNRTAAERALALQWNYGTGTFTPPGYWNTVAAEQIAVNRLNELAATRVLALMHASMMDALIGCWEAKYEYWTRRPTQVDPSITLAFALPNHPSYPSGHSCVSAAAATVLASAFPHREAELNNQVADAGLSRMYAGIHYRFDITAGANLGRAVAQYALAHESMLGAGN